MTATHGRREHAVPPVIRSAWVDRPVPECFRIFTTEIGAWWPLPTHGLFGSDAGGVFFRDGRIIEVATDGRHAVWGHVRTWEPPTRLVFSWHPGGEPDPASEVEVVFEADNGGTRVVLEHRGWEAFGEAAMARRSNYTGPNAWGYVLDHLGDRIEGHPDAADVSKLDVAYAEFFAVAEQGGFGPAPAPGEWDAKQTIAHVALNDAAMLGVTQSIIHGEPLRFENHICQESKVLAAFIEDAGDMDTLVARGRAAAIAVVGILQRLSPEQVLQPVHCHLTHDGTVMVDDQRPWGAVAIDVQAGVHIPAHIEQLRDLLR